MCHRGEFITSLPPRIEPLPGPGNTAATTHAATSWALDISQQLAFYIIPYYTCQTYGARMKAYLQVPDLLLPVGVPPGVAAVPRHPLLRLAAGQRAPGHRHLRPPQPRHRSGRPRGSRPRQDSPRLTLQVQ